MLNWSYIWWILEKKEEVRFDEKLKLYIITPPQYIMYICIGE